MVLADSDLFGDDCYFADGDAFWNAQNAAIEAVLEVLGNGRELGVEPTIPVHVRSEPWRHAVREHFDDSAERVTVFVRG